MGGWNCPLPVCAQRRRWPNSKRGQILRVVSTDPARSRGFPAFARQTGNELVTQGETGTRPSEFVLRRKWEIRRSMMVAARLAIFVCARKPSPRVLWPRLAGAAVNQPEVVSGAAWGRAFGGAHHLPSFPGSTPSASHRSCPERRLHGEPIGRDTPDKGARGNPCHGWQSGRSLRC